MKLRRPGVGVLNLGTALLVALFAASAASATTVSEDDPFPGGTWTEHRHEAEVALDSRDWFLFVPDVLPPGPVPLVVYLHGCNQTAMEAALGVRWNETAVTEGFIVAYPQQQDPNELPPDQQAEGHLFGGNGSQCWNWFRPDMTVRDGGEPSTIAAITRTVIAEHDVDPERVYLSGISAGGAMASVMGATYPDVYAAIGVIAGCGYAACSDADGAAAFAEMGEWARPLPVVLAHGTADTVAAYGMGLDALRQWIGTNDLVDDGQANGSVADEPASSVDVGLDATVLDGLGTVGDLCVRNSSVPCPGGALGLAEYPHTIDTYVDADGCELVQFWTLHGLQHAYSGGDPRGTFVDPLGPGETPIAWEFFQRHTLSGPTAEACASAAGGDEPSAGSSPAASPSAQAGGEVIAASGADELALLLLGLAMVIGGRALVRRSVAA